MINAPFPSIPAELLAKLAQGAFRPPQAMGMQAPMMPQTPGFNMGDGMSAGMGLGMGAGLFNRTSGDGRTTPEGNISGFPKGGGPLGPGESGPGRVGGALAYDPMVLTYDNPSFGDLGGGRGVQQLPSGAASSWRNLWGLF